VFYVNTIDEVIGKCISSCGGDIVENGGINARCVKCGLLYDLEILTKNHQPPKTEGFVRTWGLPGQFDGQQK